MKALQGALFALVLVLSSACTEPGETTAVGAATGGVVGAGLGAIIGNQTGAAGEGFVIGALAGAGTGAAVGNALQAQEEAIRTQDEAIERQERVVSQQRAEIEELRRMGQDRVSFDRSSSYTGRPAPQQQQLAMRTNRNALTPQQPNIEEKTIVAAQDVRRPFNTGYSGTTASSVQPQVPGSPAAVDGPAEMRGAYDWKESSAAAPAAAAVQQGSVPLEKSASPTSLSAASGSSQECSKAAQEVQSASQVSEVADKLFHYRRALRLCPSDPAYHNGLGEIYVSLQRQEDAEYEFREALKLDPGYNPALDNLQQLRSGATY